MKRIVKWIDGAWDRAIDKHTVAAGWVFICLGLGWRGAATVVGVTLLISALLEKLDV